MIVVYAQKAWPQNQEQRPLGGEYGLCTHVTPSNKPFSTNSMSVSERVTKGIQ